MFWPDAARLHRNRLADAIAGFVRDALEDETEEITRLFRKAKRDGMLVAVKP